jgi:uncharacterized protein (DUF1697 family)
MALIVFLRGINVGGHRTLRPGVVAKELRSYDVVNIGAAGTFVVRKPGTPTKFLTALRQKLPLDAVVAFCDSSDLIRLEMDTPFRTESAHPDLIQFVSILSKAGRSKVTLPVAIPEGGAWFVRITGSRNRFLFGVYRRHMKTIGYLSRIDDLFGAPATTRSWSTILSVLRTLKSDKRVDRPMRPLESPVKPPQKRSPTRRRLQAVAKSARSRQHRHAAPHLRTRG